MALVALAPSGRRYQLSLVTSGVAGVGHDIRALSSSHRLPLALLVGLTVISAVFASYFPGTLPDEALYDAKAWLLAQTEDVDYSIGIKEVVAQRPPLTSLAQGLIYLAGGTHVKLLNSGFYICFVMLFWGALDRLVGQRRWTWLVTALLATAPLLWWHSVLNLTNLAAGFYLFAGAVVLVSVAIRGRAGEFAPSRRWLFLGGICFGLAVFTRYEYVVLITLPVGMFLLLCLYRGWSGAIKWVCAGVLSTAAWWSLYMHLLSSWRGSSILQLSDIAILSGLAVLGALDHFGALVGAWRILARICRDRPRTTVAAVVVLVLGAALLVYPWARPTYFMTGSFQVFLQQRQWILSAVAVIVIVWFQRNFLTGQSALLVFGYFAAFVGMALLIAYVANYQRGETFAIFSDHHLRLYLTDPTYKIVGSWSRNMIALYPVLLFFAAIIPAFHPAVKPAAAKEGASRETSLDTAVPVIS